MATNSPAYDATQPGTEGWTTQRAARDGQVQFNNPVFNPDITGVPVTWRSGSWVLPNGNVGTSWAGLSAGNLTTYIPFVVYTRQSFSQIGTTVTTAAVGSTVELGIYASASGIPGARILTAGTVSTDTTGDKSLPISVTLDPGVYWLAAAGAVPATPFQLGTYSGQWMLGMSTTTISNATFSGFTESSATLPATATITIPSIRAWAVALRTA